LHRCMSTVSNCSTVNRKAQCHQLIAFACMNSFLAQGPTAFKEAIAQYKQLPHVSAALNRLASRGEEPRPWQLFTAMYLERDDNNAFDPKCLWLSSSGAAGKTWLLSFLEDLYVDRAVYRLSIKGIRKMMNNMSDWPDDTLILLDEYNGDIAFLKAVCARARVVVVSDCRCPDMSRRFLQIDWDIMEIIRCFSLA
jgi:hypothetical protein